MEKQGSDIFPVASTFHQTTFPIVFHFRASSEFVLGIGARAMILN